MAKPLENKKSQCPSTLYLFYSFDLSVTDEYTLESLTRILLKQAIVFSMKRKCIINQTKKAIDPLLLSQVLGFIPFYKLDYD